MFENIRVDMIRAFGEEKKLRIIDVLSLLWTRYGFQALLIYRFGRWLRSLRKHCLGWGIIVPFYPIYWVLSVCVSKAYGINLEQSADIAPGLYIAHAPGIEVRNCRIGLGCAIYQQVKLGPVEGKGKGPIIGEGVFIGHHAQIRTDITVGDGASIGGGAVVTQDVPCHCLVLGNPGRIVQRNHDNSALV